MGGSVTLPPLFNIDVVNLIRLTPCGNLSSPLYFYSASISPTLVGKVVKWNSICYTVEEVSVDGNVSIENYSPSISDIHDTCSDCLAGSPSQVYVFTACDDGEVKYFRGSAYAQYAGLTVRWNDRCWGVALAPDQNVSPELYAPLIVGSFASCADCVGFTHYRLIPCNGGTDLYTTSPLVDGSVIYFNGECYTVLGLQSYVGSTVEINSYTTIDDCSNILCGDFYSYYELSHCVNGNKIYASTDSPLPEGCVLKHNDECYTVQYVTLPTTQLTVDVSEATIYDSCADCEEITAWKLTPCSDPSVEIFINYTDLPASSDSRVLRINRTGIDTCYLVSAVSIPSSFVISAIPGVVAAEYDTCSGCQTVIVPPPSGAIGRSEFEFEIQGSCDEFDFQNETVLYSPNDYGSVFDTNLKIVFPGGEVATYADHTVPVTLAPAISNITLALPANPFKVNIEQFNQAAGSYGILLDKDGNTLAQAPWDSFPDGIYTITWSFKVGTNSYVQTKRIMVSCSIDSCIKTYTDNVIGSACDGCQTSSSEDRDKALRMIVVREGMMMAMLLQDYAEAAKYLETLNWLCDQSDCGCPCGC